MTYSYILSNLDSGILTLTLNRPDKLNALNIALLQEIKHAVTQAQNQPEVRGIVITGSGVKAFAAGADIAEFAHFNVEQGTHMSREGHEVFFAIEQSAKPVVAAVNGFALGGGCELTLACHVRFASENAKFGQPEVNLGVPPGYGGTQRLLQIIGKGRALEMLISANPIDANTALQFGLVNKVLTQEELLPYAYQWLGKVCSKSPHAVKQIIECVNTFYEPSKIGFDKEIHEFGYAFGTSDFKEGTDAFLNKRKADFKPL